ncbi:MAG: DNA-binding protein [Bacteroidaceae bacterium]|nr:DNA-binding protein [Bacteroidaceae bacterium]
MLDYSVAMLGNPQHEEDPKKAFAFLQTRGMLSISEMADHMVKHGCNYDRADIVAIITKLVSCAKELMLDSYRIQLGDLGQFFLSCKSKGAVSLKEFTENNIQEIRVNFTPSRQFENLRAEVSLHKVPSRKAAAAVLAAQLEGQTTADWTPKPEDGEGGEGNDEP